MMESDISKKVLSYRSPVPRTRFCDRSAWSGFSALAITSPCIISIQAYDSAAHQQTVLTNSCFFLSSQETWTLYCCVIRQIITIPSLKIYSGLSHTWSHFPIQGRIKLIQRWCLLTLVLASYPVESWPEQHYFMLLTVNSLIHFCQMPDGARLGNDRSQVLSNSFSAVIRQGTAYNPYTKSVVKWIKPPFSFWCLSTEGGICLHLRTYCPLTSNAN
jgi:hypothetical protein